jgi:hypothetical protein
MRVFEGSPAKFSALKCCPSIDFCFDNGCFSMWQPSC